MTTYKMIDLQDETDFTEGLTLTDLRHSANDIFWEDESYNAFDLPEQEVIENIEACDYRIERE